MTLKAQIIADAAGVFLDTDDFAHLVTHRPGNDQTRDTEVAAIVDLDAESAPELGYDANGEKCERFVSLELSAATTVNCHGENRDTFLLWFVSGRLADAGDTGATAEHWRAARVTGRDAGMQRVLCHRTTEVRTKRTGMR